LDGLVNGVVDRLAGRLGKRAGIFILASPGCSRGRLVTVLLRRGLVDVVYAYDRFGSKVGDDVRGRVIEFSSVDELAGKLGSVSGRVAVVARSTTDAIRLRDKLGNAEVIYLPEYYKDAAKKVLKGGDLEVARVRHEGLGEGISPSMLREGLPSEVKSIRELSLGKVGLGDVIKDFLKMEGEDAAQKIMDVLSMMLGVGFPISQVALSVVRFFEMVKNRWRKNRDEVLGGFVRLLRVAREVKNNYLRDERLSDERLEAVFDEVAYEWGLNIEEFAKTITNIANIVEGKQLTEEDIKKIINDNLERIEKELEKIKEEVKGQKVGVEVFFIDDLENGLLYGNFTVEGGVPKIITWVGTTKNEQNKQSEQEPPPKTDLVDAGKFRKVAEEVFSRLVKNGRVLLIGPRGIGKSTLATYVVWRSLRGSLGNMVLNEPVYAVIRVDKLNPGDALELNNLIKVAGRRFVVIYDPSPIKAYYKPEAMQGVKHGKESVKNITLKELIESVKNTLKELMEVRNAWVVIILPSELYEQVQRGKEEDVDLRQVLDNLERDVVTVNLKDEGFLREIIKRYSECDNVSDYLVKRVMDFDSYTLVAKYVGIWLRERKCKVEDVDKALRESAGEPKLFFAHYIWGIILGGNEDLAKKVSIPLILHAAFGPIPKGITYITKAVNEGGFWKLIDRNELAKSKLEGLREDDLEPIAKWLSTEHEDLIEEVLEELAGLRGKEARKQYMDHGLKRLIDTLDWSYEEVLKEVRKDLELDKAILEKTLEETINVVQGDSELKETLEEAKKLLTVIEVKPEKVEANLSNFVSERLKNALKPYANCWKRAALIIGYALARRVLVPGPEDLPEDARESIKDALDKCSVDDYLLVGNKIPPLIWYLTYTPVSTEAFIDKYNEAINEVGRVLNIVRGRGYIYGAERFYGLGLASIIAKAVESGKPVGPSDADAALYIVSFAIQHVVSAYRIIPILSTLEPLRGKAPQRYIELLAFALDVENLDLGTVRHIFYELYEILDNYGDVVRGYAWSLVHAIRAYADLLEKHLGHFNREEVEVAVRKIANLLNELDKFKSSLGVIAWAIALVPALIYGDGRDVKKLMEKALGIDVVDKANGILEKLSTLRGLVQDLMRDEEFMGYIKSKSVKADEEAVKIVIPEAASLLKYALARYRLDNDELIEARDLFNEVYKEFREIGGYEDYLVARSWALRVEAIKGSSVGKELVDGFRQLYEETFKEYFEYTAPYLRIASGILGNYLVFLALINDVEGIRKLPEEHWWVLNADKRFSVLTRLMLNALLRPKVGLSGGLEGKLGVKAEELIDAFESDMYSEFLPALKVALGIEIVSKPEDVIKLCEKINVVNCVDSVLAAKGNSAALEQLRKRLIDKFGVDTDRLFDEFMKLVYGLDGKSLAQLIAPGSSTARLALMLHALVNRNENLAKAHALYCAVNTTGSKLLRRLFLEAYRACCDPNNDGFKRAIAKLFFLHI